MSSKSNIYIDYDEVESVISDINTSLSTSEIESEYTQLISQFSSSKGDEAAALRRLLGAEKKLIEEINDMLTQFSGSIKFAVDELKGMDSSISKSMSIGTKRKASK